MQMETAWKSDFGCSDIRLCPPLEGTGRTVLALRRDTARNIPMPASTAKITNVMSIASMLLILPDFSHPIVDGVLKSAARTGEMVSRWN